ncbi:MAG: single-stranded-DNA-specific exonuclease RecJ [Deltaproteobacteria bacterium]|nr:single-stranded-DNA-specific exonuclease RecJ [Deltaproteobacteria bacterium]
MIQDPGPADSASLALAGELGGTVTVASWLHRRGFTAGEPLSRWLDPRLANLTTPDAMADLPAAVERLAFAIGRKEPIAIFGDYDCDGITSAAILTEVVRALGGTVTPLVASRFEGGYGFSSEALEKVRATGATLLVTCDCGSSDHERLESARRLGIDALVIDHHLVPEEALPVRAFLNPHRPECGFPEKGLASCGLALVVASALRRRLGSTLDVRAWLDLVAVGTIADVAPLVGDNRALVRRGLEVLSQGARVGLAALAMNGAGGRSRAWSSEDVSFQIAPRLNASGRLTDPRISLDVLLERDATRAWELAGELEELQRRRREIQKVMCDEAERDIASQGYVDDPALVLARASWHPGIVGIVAGRVASRHRKPTVVFALEGQRGKGSVRGPAGFRLHDALVACRGELERFGGHQAAAGVEVRVDRLERFRAAWNDACAAQLEANPPAPAPGPDVRLDERDELARVLRDLERLEPCGHQNPAPLLYIPAVEVLSARDLKGHLKLELRVRGERLSGFAPERGSDGAGLVGRSMAIAGRLKRDHFRGGPLPEVLVEAW